MYVLSTFSFSLYLLSVDLSCCHRKNSSEAYQRKIATFRRPFIESLCKTFFHSIDSLLSFRVKRSTIYMLHMSVDIDIITPDVGASRKRAKSRIPTTTRTVSSPSRRPISYPDFVDIREGRMSMTLIYTRT